jgi:hypothetical protein
MSTVFSEENGYTNGYCPACGYNPVEPEFPIFQLFGDGEYIRGHQICPNCRVLHPIDENMDPI